MLPAETPEPSVMRIHLPLVGKYMLSLTSALRATRREHGRMCRATALFIAAVSVAACAGSGAGHAPTVVLESPTAQSALRDILSSRKSGSESGASSQANRLLAFYKSRNFQPAWTENAQDVDEVRAVLARAHEQGLSDDDYKFAQD